ncbi:putative transposable element [Trichonephila clavipes]|uniref:Putative transposable element n=1 Tax=Trichonephila clavipes TaxID=2585209 RepID=A0A8X6V424_TRICX|nr:putative transposable element [Trichonephila clavipes]
MSHSSATIDLLKDTFGDRLMSRFEPVNWPPRSCDLTPLDYFLWGYVKSLVYADKPQTLDHLKDNIRRVIADMRPQMFEKFIENWMSRLDYIRASCGSIDLRRVMGCSPSQSSPSILVEQCSTPRSHHKLSAKGQLFKEYGEDIFQSEQSLQVTTLYKISKHFASFHFIGSV